MFERFIKVKGHNKLWQSDFTIHGWRANKVYNRARTEGTVQDNVQALWQGESHILELSARHKIRLVDDMAPLVLTVS